jgi:hypothetical protein
MRCALDFNHQFSQFFNFCLKKEKQKQLIGALLTHSKLEFDLLASVLNVSTETLNEVQSGLAFLPDASAYHMGQLLLLAFND